jgi:hypothetical protein
MSGAIPPLPHTPSWRGAYLNNTGKSLQFFLFIPSLPVLFSVSAKLSLTKFAYSQ